MKARRPIVVFGAGGFAKTIADACRAADQHEVVAFADRAPAQGASLLGVRVLDEAAAIMLLGNEPAVAVGIGDNFLRMQLTQRLMRQIPGLELVSVIHPRAMVSEYAHIGPGCVVLSGAVVGTQARLEENVSIWSNSTVEHDCVLDAGVTLGPGAQVGGGVRIGIRSFVGLGATINNGTRVGADVVIGAQSAVVGDLPDRVVAMGVPARAIRSRELGERYL